MSENTPLLPYSYKPKTTPYDSPGEWDNEPDMLTFTYLDYPCTILRNSLGALCGYIGIPSDHDYARGIADKYNLTVHGGITFSRYNEENKLFWLGFDCSHSGDFAPRYKGTYVTASTFSYCNIQYVKNEIASLVLQIQSYSRPPLASAYTISPEGILALKQIFSDQTSESFSSFCRSYILPVPTVLCDGDE